MTFSELFHTLMFKCCIFGSFYERTFLNKDICCFSFFNNSDIYYMISVYSDATQTALKYFKDMKANIHNILVMAGNFNIKNSSWDSLFSFHSIHSHLLTDIVNSLALILSNPTNQILTRYSENANDVNFIIDLMLLGPNSSEIDNHTIHSDLQYSSNHALLTVNISIIKEFVPDKQCTIIKKQQRRRQIHH